jgi:hypothetical protein
VKPDVLGLRLSQAATPAVQERPLRAGPVSVFVSRKERKLFVRKGFEPIFDMPVKISEPDRPLGTHVFTAMEDNPDGVGMRWTVVSMPAEPPKPPRNGKGQRQAELQSRPSGKGKTMSDAVADVPPPVTPAAALDRIEIPPEALERISGMLSVGASLIISDQGLGPETGRETDFIVLTR